MWPSPDGSLSQMVSEVPFEEGKVDHRGWVFVDIDIYEDGTHDFTTRGLVAGNIEEAHAFVEMCRKLGFCVMHGSPDTSTGFIPLSNGMKLLAKRPGGGSYIFGYSDREVRLCRIDLPTRNDLEAIRHI